LVLGDVRGDRLGLVPVQRLLQRDVKAPSPLSDVYALGMVTYECLTGHPPFDDDNQVAVSLAHLNQQPPPLPERIPSRVRTLVDTTLEKDPHLRIPDAETFAATLEELRSP